MASTFKTNLIEFFKEHDPNAITVVPRIVKTFSHRQKEVYEYLSDRYGVEIDYEYEVEEPTEIDNTGGPVPEADQGAEPF